MSAMPKILPALCVASFLVASGCGKKSQAVSPPPLPPSATHNRGFSQGDFAAHAPPTGMATRMPSGEDGLLDAVELVVEEVESNVRTPVTGLGVRRPPPPPKLLPRGEDPAAATKGTTGKDGETKDGDAGAEASAPPPFQLPDDMISASDLEKRTRLIAVKVKVTSKRENPRVLVQPERFTLEPYRSGEGGTYPLLHSFRKSPVLPTVFLQEGESTSGWLTFRVPADRDRFKLRAEIRSPPIEVVIELP